MLHRKAGTWLSEKGLIEEALHHFIAGKNIRAAVGLISQQRYDMMSKEQWPRLEHWLDMILSSSLEKYPELQDPRFPPLPEELHFIHAEEILAKYPDLPRKERETKIIEEYGAVFI
ncbi:MAG: hypothetical protein GY755_00095, partial [Chloroflexi bacterium]|nr:hypothetical protein [Chloroflexota bacterium]